MRAYQNFEDINPIKFSFEILSAGTNEDRAFERGMETEREMEIRKFTEQFV